MTAGSPLVGLRAGHRAARYCAAIPAPRIYFVARRLRMARSHPVGVVQVAAPRLS